MCCELAVQYEYLSHRTYTEAHNILHIQVNGVPVNTGGGGLTVELCEGLPDLLNTIKEMATGNTMFTVTLHHKTKVQLVPRKLHQLLLGSLQDAYTHRQVFSQRSEHRGNGPYYETIPKASAGEQQLFLLRAIAISGSSESDSGDQKLALLVKVFNTETDRSCNSGLKLGLVYGETLVGDKSTVQKYVHNGSAARSPEQGPRIVMPKHMATSPAQSPALGGHALNKTRRFKNASAIDSCQQQAATGCGKQSSSNLHPMNSAVSDVQSGEQASSSMLVWTDKPEPIQDGGTQSKKTKHQSISSLLPRFDSGTCESLVPLAVAKSFKHLTPAEFGVQVVMNGHLAVPPTSLVGHALRQDRAAVWSALYAFWSSLAMQSVAGVLALALDGYGHGKMNVLTKLQYNGCCGRWDMMAVLAAKYLGLFPSKYVSAAHK